MSFCDIFNFDESKITFSAPINNVSNDIKYSKIYLNYQGDRFNFELPPVEVILSKNSKKQYDAYTSKIRLNLCPKKDQVIDIFEKIRILCIKHIEQNKSKLDFKNKNKFNSQNCDNFNNPLYYITDKETGEVKKDMPPLLFANLIFTQKGKTLFKYPNHNGTFSDLPWEQYLGERFHCIPIIQVSNLYISSDGDIRIQLYMKQSLVFNIIKENFFDSNVFSKYDISQGNFSTENFSQDNFDEELKNMEDI